MVNVNWDELKTEYITSDISYRDMAEKYKVPFRTLCCQALKYKWVEGKRNYREKIVTKAVEKSATKEANRLAGIARSADKMSDVIEKVMNDSDQFYRSIDIRGDEVIRKKVDTKAIRELSTAMKELTQVLRNVYNLPTEQESISMQLARERLEIEKKNAEKDDEITLNAGVVFIPQVVEEEDE